MWKLSTDFSLPVSVASPQRAVSPELLAVTASAETRGEGTQKTNIYLNINTSTTDEAILWTR